MSKYLRMKGSVEDISGKSVISNCTKSKFCAKGSRRKLYIPSKEHLSRYFSALSRIWPYILTNVTLLLFK